MSKASSQEKWRIPNVLGPCACSQLRRTARKVSLLYDQALSTSGLTVTQYALLVNVARAGKVSRTALAIQLGMDRTTLTRNLKPLEKAKLIQAAMSSDRRERLLCLSAAGHRQLCRSYALWEKAQETFASELGADALAQLRTALETAEAAAEAAMKTGSVI